MIGVGYSRKEQEFSIEVWILHRDLSHRAETNNIDRERERFHCSTVTIRSRNPNPDLYILVGSPKLR